MIFSGFILGLSLLFSFSSLCSPRSVAGEPEPRNANDSRVTGDTSVCSY